MVLQKHYCKLYIIICSIVISGLHCIGTCKTTENEKVTRFPSRSFFLPGRPTPFLNKGIGEEEHSFIINCATFLGLRGERQRWLKKMEKTFCSGSNRMNNEFGRLVSSRHCVLLFVMMFLFKDVGPAQTLLKKTRVSFSGGWHVRRTCALGPSGLHSALYDVILARRRSMTQFSAKDLVHFMIDVLLNVYAYLSIHAFTRLHQDEINHIEIARRIKVSFRTSKQTRQRVTLPCNVGCFNN